MVSTERKLTGEILKLINLVELRKVHLQMGYSSLFEYLTRYLGYNESAAYRRMQAARLLRDCPEMTESVQNGKLHLTQMAQLQAAIKAQQRQSHRLMPRETKLALLVKLESKNSLETQKILVQELEVCAEKPVSRQVQCKRDESVYLTLHLSKDQYACLLQAQKLLSHIGNGRLEEVIESLCHHEIQRRQGALRRKLPQEQRGCQYRDPKTQRLCGETFQLQLDHIQPKWAGGSDEPSNRQLLCGAHNRFKYQQEAGIRSS